MDCLVFFVFVRVGEVEIARIAEQFGAALSSRSFQRQLLQQQHQRVLLRHRRGTFPQHNSSFFDFAMFIAGV